MCGSARDDTRPPQVIIHTQILFQNAKMIGRQRREFACRMCGSRLFVADFDLLWLFQCVIPSLRFDMLVLTYLQQNLEDVKIEKRMRSFSPKWTWKMWMWTNYDRLLTVFCTNNLSQSNPFTQITFYPNNLLHAPTKFLPVVVYTDILLHQPFSLTTLYTNNLLR